MQREDPTDEQAILEDIRQNLKEAIDFYSNKNKAKREAWVVSRFLTIADIRFSESEIIKSPSEPPDVLFRDAEFEVKEVLDEGRRRHDEYVKKLGRAETATKLQDLMERYPPAPITIGEIATRIKEDLEYQTTRYPADVRRALDILYYVNPQHRYLYSIRDWPSFQDFSSYGWRSICFLKGNAVGVFYTSPESPEFIRKLDGKITVYMHYIDD